MEPQDVIQLKKDMRLYTYASYYSYCDFQAGDKFLVLSAPSSKPTVSYGSGGMEEWFYVETEDFNEDNFDVVHRGSED